MKLPDFKNSFGLNALKESMGIARDVYGTIRVTVDPSRLTELELERLTSPDGLEIAADEFRVLPDKTLAFKNSRVLLYIRDVTVMGGREVEPKFHLSGCRTLTEMKRKRRFDRYVVSTRVDGRFAMNLIDGARSRRELVALKVCQNCLELLSLDGFSIDGWKRSRRLEYVSAFQLEEFFRRFPRSLHVEVPTYNADDAPLNNYTPDFPEVSRRAKQAAGYRCQRPTCGHDLSSPAFRKFLHVHHRNGQKSDNSLANLEVLCIRCHAEAEGHGHMRSLPEYREFMSMLGGGARVSPASTKSQWERTRS